MTLETRASYSLPSHLEGDGRRLNQQHEVFRLLLPSFSLLLTPLPPGYSGKVLDVGTGTGICTFQSPTALTSASDSEVR